MMLQTPDWLNPLQHCVGKGRLQQRLRVVLFVEVVVGVVVVVGRRHDVRRHRLVLHRQLGAAVLLDFVDFGDFVDFSNFRNLAGFLLKKEPFISVSFSSTQSRRELERIRQWLYHRLDCQTTYKEVVGWIATRCLFGSFLLLLLLS